MRISLLGNIFVNLDVENLGQVFTPQHIVSDMLGLIQNTTKMKNPRFLEPSCGNGAFFKHLPQNKIAIELDSNVIADSNVLNTDFFSYPVSEKFDVIIGNPPYVRYQDIVESTKFLLSRYSDMFDSRSNLYLFFYL